MALISRFITLILILFSILNCSQSQNNKNNGTTCVFKQKLSNYVKKRFRNEQLNVLCERGKQWKNSAEKSRGRSINSLLSKKQMDYFNDVQTCNDLLCLCKSFDLCKKFMGTINQLTGNNKTNILQTKLPPSLTKIIDEGKTMFSGLGRKKRQAFPATLQPAVRKEFRMMSDDERTRWSNAMNRLKTDVVDGLSKYDILTVYHIPENAPGAHFGPAFLPFHRELIKRLEVAARQVDPSVATPYWDSTLDQALPNPADSILWSDQFLGNGNGPVTSGPFRGWLAHDHPTARRISPNLQLTRAVGQSQFGSLYKPEDLAQVSSRPTFNDLSFCKDPFFELVHGAVHIWVGGHMDPLETSPNDPTFFLLHTFVDKLWEDWRTARQNPSQRETEYPEDAQVCNQFHYKNAIMKPFDIKNVDGLSNSYTSTMYRYDPSPTCSQSQPSCVSPYLFCDTRTFRCVAKIRQGGNCAGLSQFNACHLGDCVNNLCVARSGQQTTPFTTPFVNPSTPITSRPIAPQTQTTRPPIVPGTTTLPTNQNTAELVWIPVMIQQKDSSGQQVAKPNIRITTTNSMTKQTYPGEVLGGSDSDTSYPYYPGFARVPLPSPALSNGHSECSINVAAADGTSCQSNCYRGAAGYQPCDARVTLDFNPTRSDNIAFTPFKDQAAYLSWNGPSKIPDPFLFNCNPGTAPITVTTLPPTTFPPVTNPSAYPDPDCNNRHRCCSFWASVGECGRNTGYMNAACTRACGACTDNSNLNGCIDYFHYCPSWAANGECDNNAIWMEENCKKSCNVCSRSQNDIKSLCGAPKDPGCNDNNQKCAQWARNGECERNPWWMSENCKISCKQCTKR